MAKPKSSKFAHEHKREPIHPIGFSQERYFSAIHEEVDDKTGSGAFVIAHGAAGTGKTFVAATLAADAYLNGGYEQIIIIKPTVGPDEMGFLPGTVEEKLAPWIETVTEPLKQRIGFQKFKNDFGKNIHAVALEYVRGRTYDDAFIIVDEAQNLTKGQMKVILTRIGLRSKMVFCGDDKQVDLPEKCESGLTWFIDKCRARREPGIEIVEFKPADCVRSGACKKALTIIES